MAALSLDACKEDILNKLREAGSAGLPKSKLTAGASSKKKTEAIKELEKNLRIANMGSKSKTRYVLQEFNKPVEIAYEIIEKKTAGKMMLFSQTALMKDCPPGSIREHAKKAIDWLVKEKKLLNPKYGKNALYLHVSAFQFSLPSAQTEPEKKMSHPELSREQVLAAYRKVKARVGFSNREDDYAQSISLGGKPPGQSRAESRRLVSVFGGKPLRRD